MRYDADLLLAVHLSSYIRSNHSAATAVVVDVVAIVPATVAVSLTLG